MQYIYAVSKCLCTAPHKIAYYYNYYLLWLITAKIPTDIGLSQISAK